ncbi:MAG: hypothetical protein S4CHLAM45_04200 [Chlamydiales bacterium]|nr:hypothetical protein [Chlamydiales bacterium]MCH9619274.1 hypothetical protein [Chlamydiales bacterium]MCH9622536.1 hypothetical protein [Chlamydiales bacterium]
MLDTIGVTKRLLDWNRKNLVASADLKREDLSNLFASKFLVKANGRSYDANYDNYFEFLNAFRADISSISYELQEFIAQKNKVVTPMQAKIVRTNGKIELIEAILILGFDKQQKITLWQEIYVEIP